MTTDETQVTDEAEITTRDLVESGLGPLRKFTGIFESAPTTMQTFTGNDGTSRQQKVATLQYKDVEVIKSITPYALPIFTIRFGIAVTTNSKWGIFSKSFNDIVDAQYSPEQNNPQSSNYIPTKDRTQLKQTFGLRHGLVLCDGLEGRPAPFMVYNGRTREEAATPIWNIYSIEGYGVAGAQGVVPMDKAIEVLDGKTLAQFNAIAYEDEVIKSDPQLLTMIGLPISAPNSFANTMLAAGKFIKDEQEIFHLVK